MSLSTDMIAAVMKGTRSLPRRYYTDPEVLALERTEIFFKTWQYACHASQLTESGRFVTLDLFDQSLFLVRDEEGTVHAFFNVCPHRGHPLVAGQGRVQRFVCPYHAWTYDLEGRLLNARNAEDSGLFCKNSVGLTRVRVERLLDFYFVNLDFDAPSLREYAGELERGIRKCVPDLSAYQLEAQLEYIGAPFECNWKVMLDNQLECYHCEPAHPGFGAVMNLKQTRNFIGNNLVYQHIPTHESKLDAPFPYDREGDVRDGNFWTLFPNTVLARSPGSPTLSISRVQPLSPSRTARVIQVLSRPDADKEGDEARTRWLREGVIAEDRDICEAVQRGMNQIGFSQGYYAIDPEAHHRCEEPVRYFHQRYLSALHAGLEKGDCLSRNPGGWSRDPD